MTVPRVLAFCPTYQIQGKDQIWPQTRKSLRALRFAGELTKHISRINPYMVTEYGKVLRDTGLENVLTQYQAGYAMTMAGGYDALLTVEHDMIFEPDALQQLWDMDKPVAYGVYIFRHGPPRISAWRNVRSKHADMSISIFPGLVEEYYRKGSAQVSGAGFGFTLIRRAVLEQVGNFHRGTNGGHPSPDVPFANDCMRLGIEQWSNFNVKLGHIRPDGSVLWPPYTKGKTENMYYEKMQFIALQSFNAQVEGHLMKFNAGDWYELPDNSEVKDLINGGYLSRVPTEPKPLKPAVKKTPRRAAKKVAQPAQKVSDG